jgi:hypothetical protein
VRDRRDRLDWDEICERARICNRGDTDDNRASVRARVVSVVLVWKPAPIFLISVSDSRISLAHTVARHPSRKPVRMINISLPGQLVCSPPVGRASTIVASGSSALEGRKRHLGHECTTHTCAPYSACSVLGSSLHIPQSRVSSRASRASRANGASRASVS